MCRIYSPAHMWIYTDMCVCICIDTHIHTHTQNVFLIHARELRGNSELQGSGWENLKKVRTDFIIKLKQINSVLDFVLNGDSFFLVFCFAFKKKNHDLTRIRRRMLNHCELTNETHLHYSKQLPLIHGGDWLHQES